MNASNEAPVIHVVDDDPEVRTAICRLLRAARYQVRAYASADDFLASANHEATGCILLDIHMPGMMGLELLSTLAQREHSLPVVVMSGSGDPLDSVRAIQAGAVAFVSKMAGRHELVNAIECALARGSNPLSLVQNSEGGRGDGPS